MLIEEVSVFLETELHNGVFNAKMFALFRGHENTKTNENIGSIEQNEKDELPCLGTRIVRGSQICCPY